MRKLVIDIGNTKSKLGIFEGEDLIFQVSHHELTLSYLNELLTNHSVKNIIYSTVAGMKAEIQEFLHQHHAMMLSTKLSLPFDNQYHTPHTLGRDRIAVVAAAVHLFPTKNCIIIDAGTCITYDWLMANQSYLGGNISPGLEMRLKAMHTFTNALPLSPLQWDGNTIGKSTEGALQNGALWGSVLEMEGIIDWSKSKWKDINVILTGGNADFFANHMKSKIFAIPNLVLIGLNKILDYNVRLEE